VGYREDASPSRRDLRKFLLRQTALRRSFAFLSFSRPLLAGLSLARRYSSRLQVATIYGTLRERIADVLIQPKNLTRSLEISFAKFPRDRDLAVRERAFK
jgi:hypothetical protein